MVSQEVAVRKATPPDVPAIVALNDALFQEDAGQRDPSVNLDWAKQHGAGHFAEMVDGDDSGCFVAVANRDIVGYLAYRLHRPNDYRLVTSAELESIFVRPQWRSRQVGGGRYQQ